MTFNKEEKRLIIELICNEQTNMIIEDNNLYQSKRYELLEELKIKIKDLEENKINLREDLNIK